MQQKHKKKGHARPIVPVHAAAAGPAKPGIARTAAGNSATRPAKHKQAGAAQPKQQQQQHVKAANLGKRKQPEGTQQQQPGKKQQQQQKQGGAPSHQQQPRQQPQQQQQQQGHEQQQRGHKQQQHGHQQHAGQQGKHAQQGRDKQQQQQQYFKKRSSKPKHMKQGVDAAAAANGDAAAASTKPADAAAVSAPAADAAPPAAAAAAAKPWQPKQAAAIGSNWQALKQQLVAEAAAKPKRPRKGAGQAPAAGGSSSSSAAKKQISSIGHNKDVTAIVAMDCEMVGVGPGGERDSLARVSIVNAAGNVLLDSFVAQKEPVTDYRTWVSGVTAKDVQGAPALEEVQKTAAELLQGRTLVGHGLSKDLRVLMLSHPRKAIRDTAKYPPFMFSKGGKRKPRALRHLASQELGLAIQEGQHSSVDDARAALYLYQKHAAVWERALKTPSGLKDLPTGNRPAAKKKRVESYRLRDVQDDPMADL